MERILVFGNSSTDREVRALIIEFRGYHCATAGSLDEAINLLHKGLFDVVVTDLNMGGSPGEIVGHLKKVCPEIAVVALTDHSETVEGADEILPVPFSPERLFHSIEVAVGKLARLRVKSRREKRASTRYPLSLPCSIRMLHSPQTEAVRGQTVDISSGGLYLVAAGDWKMGTQVQCIIQLPAHAVGSGSAGIRSQGRIVRAIPEEQGGIGLGVTIESFEFIDYKVS